jgi:3-hydroxyisobutyrate dehydrogenase-like beta-hydroxyacid dehydrogenase
MKKIGIVGLGIMGRGMAANFLKKGHQVFVWNRTSSVAEQFIAQGATVCVTPAEVATNAELIFEVTANDESSQQVWLGEGGIMSGADSSKILVASATLSIAWIEELIAVCHAQGLQFLDIALTGGRVGAETGNLTLLVGGEAAILEKISPDLQSIATKILHL